MAPGALGLPCSGRSAAVPATVGCAVWTEAMRLRVEPSVRRPEQTAFPFRLSKTNPKARTGPAGRELLSAFWSAVSLQMRQPSASVKCQRCAAPLGPLAPFTSCGDAVACNARVAQWTMPHPHRDGVATRNNSARLGMDQGLYLAVAGTDPSGSNTPSYTCRNGGRTVRHCCAAFRFGHSCRSDAHPAVEQSAPVCCPKSVGGACLTAAHRIRSDVLSTYSDRQAALL
jgi:hypothetical protein